MSGKVYVGGLGNSGDKQELWRVFSKYGTLREVWVAQNPPGFAFVEFEDSREAEEAVHALDGRRLGDKKLRVEFSKTRNRGGGRGGGRRGGYSGGGRSDRSSNYRRDDSFSYSARSYNDQRFQQPRRRSPPPRSQDHSPQARYRESRRRSRSRSPVKHSG